ncbi:MAG: hypothetical protein H7834_12560 [Magnetococcus sp. YQC-9]
MKGLLAPLANHGGKWLFIVAAAPLAAACGHTIDPTQAPLTTYEMPAAVVVHTPPVMLNPGSPWQVPMPANAVGTTYASQPNGGAVPVAPAAPVTSAPATDANGHPLGSTVVRQAPITIERPSIVVNQPPVWVGNPPVAIPQPPVIMHQAPITIEQPSFVIQPPRVGFQVPQPPAVTESKPAPEAKPVPAAPVVEEKATAKPEVAKKPAKKVAKKAPRKSAKPAKQAPRKSQAPSNDLPPK